MAKSGLAAEFDYATEKEVATLRGKSIDSIRNDRYAGRGPVWIKDGNRVLYPKAKLREWLAARTVDVVIESVPQKRNVIEVEIERVPRKRRGGRR